jgi:hypothetical protein
MEEQRKNNGRIKEMKEQWKKWNNGTMEGSKGTKE